MQQSAPPVRGTDGSAQMERLFSVSQRWSQQFVRYWLARQVRPVNFRGRTEST